MKEIPRPRITPKSSIFKDVYWVKRDKKWHSHIKVYEKRIYLGSFDLELEAAKAYDEAAKKYYGDFALLNLIGVCS